MAVKVAINGFGRIGRLAFRQMFGAEGYEVVAIWNVQVSIHPKRKLLLTSKQALERLLFPHQPETICRLSYIM